MGSLMPVYGDSCKLGAIHSPVCPVKTQLVTVWAMKYLLSWGKKTVEFSRNEPVLLQTYCELAMGFTR